MTLEVVIVDLKSRGVLVKCCFELKVCSYLDKLALSWQKPAFCIDLLRCLLYL